MKIVIVGGGSAGWMAASYFSKVFTNLDITVVESQNIPRIGVGESVTPHVAQFFSDLGINTHEWMKETNSVYKWANKFIGWRVGGTEYEYFSFSYPTNPQLLYKDIDKPFTIEQVYTIDGENLSSDYLLDLYDTQELDKFDKYFNSQFHYMEKNVSPFDGIEQLLNVPFSGAQHINAEQAAEYLKNRVALANGVKHIKDDVIDIAVTGDNIDHLKLSNGEIIKSDLFIDATGFNKILATALGWKNITYKNNVVDSAWVCPLDYQDIRTELVNYTQSVAQDHGWMFKIGLYHRMGSGYCFSGEHVDSNKVLDEYYQLTSNHRADPRLIKWTPGRLEKSANGNTVAIGLACGFVEPMEANALYTIINSIVRLGEVIKSSEDTGVLDYKDYNTKINASIDDIADFILVHYTLSNRCDNDFWAEMKNLGHKEDHQDILYQKYKSKYNSMHSALQGYTMFPQYMWAQLATYLDVDVSKWNNVKQDYTYDLAKLYFSNLEKKHDTELFKR